jgi:hypothetical protein
LRCGTTKSRPVIGANVGESLDSFYRIRRASEVTLAGNG